MSDGSAVLTLLRVPMAMLVVSKKKTTPKKIPEETPTHCEAEIPSLCSRTEGCPSTLRQEDLCCPFPCAEQKGAGPHWELVGPAAAITLSWALPDTATGLIMISSPDTNANAGDFCLHPGGSAEGNGV